MEILVPLPQMSTDTLPFCTHARPAEECIVHGLAAALERTPTRAAVPVPTATPTSVDRDGLTVAERVDMAFPNASPLLRAYLIEVIRPAAPGPTFGEIAAAVPFDAVEGLPENWRALRARVLARDGLRCRRCRTNQRLTVHHIRPRDMGGTHDERNLITLCAPCHDRAEILTAERGEALSWNDLTNRSTVADSDSTEALSLNGQSAGTANQGLPRQQIRINRDAARLPTRRGRPRRVPSALRAKAADRARAYRQRQKAAQLAANDALLARA